jgi:outer membrane protein OmpA-like peptidoglycan-associated protein/opacity protein-like surface antigen
MKTKHLILLGTVLAFQSLYAQTADNKVALGLNLTRSEHNGDTGNGLWDFNQSYFGEGFGLSLATYLNPSFDLGLQGNFGKYGYRKDEINRFIGNKLDMSLFGHYKLNNGYIFHEESRISPFLSAGIGFASNSKEGDDHDRYSRIIEGKDLIIPLGAGLKWQISNGFALQYQYLYNLTNHDNVDQIRRNPELDIYHAKRGNDAFGEHLLSMVFSLCKAKDTDMDGVADKMDKCPDTPMNVAVDDWGCPIDTDNDGVADYLDKCPNTPNGVKVNMSGCPVDSDKDGVADYLDKCSGTPANVKVDANGCPLDSDGDGVADYLDKCPGTPKNMKVDANGCPMDSDGDGVADNMDKCSGTPKNVKVDANGCPIDTDKDGVPDYLDKCPDVPGLVANKGCPEVKAETKKIFAQALQGIQFETGKDIIKTNSYPILNKVVTVMNDNPSYNLEIKGYTDNKGDEVKNLELSQKRADAVKNYLVKKGVDESRLMAKGFGQDFPVANNATAAGRAKNRRVEFTVNF